MLIPSEPITTLSISVPPRQAISAGWRLLRLGIWYWLTRRDLWVSAGFSDHS